MITLTEGAMARLAEIGRYDALRWTAIVFSPSPWG
jgi:hypothetical protein